MALLTQWTQVWVRSDINSGVLTADKLYYIHNKYDEAAMKDSFHAAVCNLADGTVTMSDDVKGLFAQTEDDWFYLQYLAVDADAPTKRIFPFPITPLPSSTSSISSPILSTVSSPT